MVNIKRPIFINASQLANVIANGATIAVVGMTLVGSSEAILKSIEKRFIETGEPNNLTIVHSSGQSDRRNGLQHLAHEGMVKRIIGGHWGLQPKWMDLISSNKVEAYCLPQGQIAQLYRSIACGLPGKISKVGLGTFIDPRLEGGKMNERTKILPDIVEVVNFQGEEYLFYKSIPLDFVIIRGTTADEDGNITIEEEAMKLEILPAVMATKRFGGKVLVQVKNVAQRGTLNPKNVVVPGVFVDFVAVSDNPFEEHKQTSSSYFNPAYTGDIKIPINKIESIPLNIRKVIGRMALTKLKRNSIINVGTGIPNDVIGSIASEEGVLDEFMLTVESGIYGGVPEGGVDFGIAKNPVAMITHDAQFDYYDGTGVDFTFMGAGEVDIEGNVNATKLGNRATGCGGFIDITQNAKNIVFCLTFTADGLDIEFVDGHIKIINEGRIKKFVKKVNQISFNGPKSILEKQKVYYITERAIFELKHEGLVITAIAPGIDIKKDILDQMEFTPIISSDMEILNKSIFIDSPFGLSKYLK